MEEDRCLQLLCFLLSFLIFFISQLVRNGANYVICSLWGASGKEEESLAKSHPRTMGHLTGITQPYRLRRSKGEERKRQRR